MSKRRRPRVKAMGCEARARCRASRAWARRTAYSAYRGNKLYENAVFLNVYIPRYASVRKRFCTHVAPGETHGTGPAPLDFGMLPPMTLELSIRWSWRNAVRIKRLQSASNGYLTATACRNVPGKNPGYAAYAVRLPVGSTREPSLLPQAPLPHPCTYVGAPARQIAAPGSYAAEFHHPGASGEHQAPAFRRRTCRHVVVQGVRPLP